MYARAFGYADDVVLIAPSVGTLREIVSICKAYAAEYNLLLNPSKSKVMYITCYENLNVKLCGRRCFWYHMKPILVIIGIGSDIFDSTNLFLRLIKGVIV